MWFINFITLYFNSSHSFILPSVEHDDVYDVAHESYIDQGEGDADPQGELQEFSIGFSHS